MRPRQIAGLGQMPRSVLTMGVEGRWVDGPFSWAQREPSSYSTSRSSSRSSLLPTRTMERCGDARALQSVSQRLRSAKDCRLGHHHQQGCLRGKHVSWTYDVMSYTSRAPAAPPRPVLRFSQPSGDLAYGSRISSQTETFPVPPYPTAKDHGSASG